MHPSRDGERHLWTFVGYKRSQSIICNLYIARNGFRNLGGIICKSHCNLYPSHFATPQYFKASGSLVMLTHLLYKTRYCRSPGNQHSAPMRFGQLQGNLCSRKETCE